MLKRNGKAALALVLAAGLAGCEGVLSPGLLLTAIDAIGGLDDGFDIDTDETLAIAVADFNDDGYPDIAAGRYNLNSEIGAPYPSWIEVHFQDRLSPGGFLAPETFDVGGQIWDIAAGDVDDDGFPDIVTANTSTQNISVLRNRSSNPGTFHLTLEVETGLGPDNAFIGDVDRDGTTDILVSDSRISMISRDSGRPAGYRRQPTSDTGTAHVTAADMNLDGYPDLIHTDVLTSDYPDVVAIRLQDPSAPGTFAGPRRFSVGGQVSVILAGDFNGDGFEDVAVGISPPSASEGPHLVVFMNDPGDPGQLIQARVYQTCTFARGLAIDDLDGDGSLDIVVSGTRGRRTCISVHRQTAPFSGIFRPAEYYQGADEYIAQSVHTADLNGDGFPDIAVADEGISVFFQSPGAPGRFGPVTRVFEDD